MQGPKTMTYRGKRNYHNFPRQWQIEVGQFTISFPLPDGLNLLTGADPSVFRY
jgi:hypothetical protein